MKERLQLKKWLNGITNVLFCLCLLVVILIVLQVFVVTSFKIPSDSMEPSLLAGDCILVDKCSGGARLFNVLDAVEKKEVKIQRMSGWRNYQRNDVLVFNFPYPKQNSRNERHCCLPIPSPYLLRTECPMPATHISWHP